MQLLLDLFSAAAPRRRRHLLATSLQIGVLPTVVSPGAI